MLSSFNSGSRLVLGVVGTFLAMAGFSSFGEENGRTQADIFPMSTVSNGESLGRPLSRVIRWKGREYDIEDGITLVMQIVRNPKEHVGPWNAATALGELANLGTELKGRPCLDELETIYDNAKPLQKQLILTCFLGSRDPRALPMFVDTLDKEQDMKLRLLAAGGLAGWNIRRGVAELSAIPQ